MHYTLENSICSPLNYTEGSPILIVSICMGKSIRIQRVKPECVELPLSKRPQIGFQDQLSLNAGKKYCRMLKGEHSAILSTFIKLPFVIKTFVLSIFEWPFYIGFTVV